MPTPAQDVVTVDYVSGVCVVTITVRDAGTGVEISHLTVSAAATTRTTA